MALQEDGSVPAGIRVLGALAAGRLRLPNDPSARLSRLIDWGRSDPAFARLAAVHANAVTILGELGGPAPGGQLWAVWTGSPHAVTAAQHRGGWMLSGLRPDCVGTDVCRRALMTARTDAGIFLYAVDATDLDVVGEIPPAPDGGRTLALTAVRGTQLGGADAYYHRPGRWRHRIDIAACWFGGALGVTDEVKADDAVAEDMDAAERLLSGAAARFETLPWSAQRSLADHVCRGVKRHVAAALTTLETVEAAPLDRIAAVRAQLHIAAPVGSPQQRVDQIAVR